MCVRMCHCMCVCLCLPINNITQKQIIAEIPNFVFNIFIICMCNLKIFMKIEQVVHRGTQKKLRPMVGISFKVILIHLDYTKCDERNTHFLHGQKHITN